MRVALVLVAILFTMRTPLLAGEVVEPASKKPASKKPASKRTNVTEVAPAIKRATDQMALLEKQCSNGHYSDAVGTARTLINLQEKAYGEEHPETAVGHSALGRLLSYAGKREEGLGHLKRALAIREANLEPTHPLIVESISLLAGAYRARKKLKLASSLLDRALRIEDARSKDESTKKGDDDPKRIIPLLNEIAGLHIAKRNPAEAVPVLERAIRIYEQDAETESTDHTAAYMILARLREREGDRDKAEALLRRALKYREASFGRGHTTVSSVLDHLGQLLFRARRYKQAEAMFVRVVEIRVSTLGEIHKDVSVALNNLALTLRKQGKRKEALPLLTRALKIIEQARGPFHEDVALMCSNLGLLHHRMRNYRASLPLLKRALEIRESLYGPTDPKLVSDLANLGLEYKIQGNARKAMALLVRMIAIQESHVGTKHISLVSSLNNLASMAASLSAYEQSLEFTDRALRIIRAQPEGTVDDKLANALYGRARTLSGMGRLDEALALFERVLEIQERLYGKSHYYIAETLSSIAMVWRSRRQYGKARGFYERAAEMSRLQHGEKHPSYAEALCRLASVLRTMGFAREARPLVERALEISQHALGKESARVASALTALGLVLQEQGDPDRAYQLHKRAWALNESLHGKMHRAVAANMNNVAVVSHTLGRYAESRALFEKALSIWSACLGEDHPFTARLLSSMGWAALKWGDDKLCTSYATRAKESLERAKRTDSVDYSRTIHTLANVAFKRKNYELASKHLASAFRLERAHQVTRILTTPERHLSIADQDIASYARGATVVASKLGTSAYDYTLFFKGMTSRMRALRRRLTRSMTARDHEHWRQLKRTERNLATVSLRPPHANDTEARGDWQAEYARLSSKRASLMKQLMVDSADVRSALQSSELDTDDIQAALPSGSLLVDFLSLDGSYWAWIVPSKGEVRQIELGGVEQINGAAERLLAQTTRVRSGDWAKASGALHALVVEPVLKGVGADVDTLFICPDDALSAIPWFALRSSSSPTFLASRFSLNLISVAQELVPRASLTPAREIKGALVVGGVDFDGVEDSADAGQAQGVAKRSRARGRYSFLENSLDEALAVSKRIGSGAVKAVGANATEGFVREHASGKRIVHFATHGFLRHNSMRGLRKTGGHGAMWLGSDVERQLAAGHDPLSLSGLALAGANTAEGGGNDDGILTSLEATMLDLEGTELVVLSACESALGKTERGEGVTGPVRAFLVAGAQQVMGTLWKVDDKAAHALMNEFYVHYLDEKAPKSPATALRLAQASVRSNEKWKHPYFWAAWTLWGVAVRSK